MKNEKPRKSFQVKLDGNCTSSARKHRFISTYYREEDFTIIEVNNADSKADARKIGAKFGEVLGVE